jgi:hypothetical protein
MVYCCVFDKFEHAKQARDYFRTLSLRAYKEISMRIDSFPFLGRLPICCMTFFMISFSLSSMANSVGASIGIHGIAVDYTWQLSDQWGVRFAVTDMPFTDKLEADGIRYDLEYDRSNVAALVDFMPWENSFHFTAGLFAFEHQWLIGSKLNGDYFIGNGQYKLNDVKLSGDIIYSAASPYIGLGWKNMLGLEGRWHITVEAGLLYVGSAVVDYGATGEVCNIDGLNCLNAALSPNFQQSLTEEESQLEEKLEDYEIWPVIQLGLNYSF